MKKTKVNKNWHTPNTKIGMGDSYGTGVRNKTARSLDVTPLGKTSKNVGKPPKSLA